MDRPEIKDKKVLEYVKYLEKQLSSYTSDRTVAKSYLGFKNIVDQMNEIMSATKLIIHEVDEDGKDEAEVARLRKEHRKQQQILERSLDVSDRIEKYTVTLENMEKRVKADILTEVKEESAEAGSIYEEALKIANAAK